MRKQDLIFITEKENVMKKILGLLLVLCMLIGAIPVLTASASAAASSSDLDEYEELYVQEGMTILLSGFTLESAALNYDIGAGTWKSKIGDAVATMKGPWMLEEDGGVGYNLAGSNHETGIHFDINDLPKGDFTVEIVANARGYTVNAAGKIPVTTTGLYGIGVEGCFAFGPLKGYGFPAEREPDYSKYTYQALVNGQIVTKTVTEADIKNNATYLDVNGVEKAVSSAYNYLSGNAYAYNELRWYYSEAGLTWHTTYAKYGAYGLIWENTWRNNRSAKAVTVKHNLIDNASSEYTFLCDGTPAASLKMPGSGNSKAPYFPVEEGMEFVLFRDMPATVYAVRVYDRVLESKEVQQNHFVDIASYYGLNLKNFKKLTDDQKEAVYEIFATADFTSKKADIESLLESATATTEPFDPTQSLYVTEGLKTLLVSYDEFASSLKLMGSTNLWVDQVDGSAHTLLGKGWQRLENGGVKISRTFSEWQVDKNFGLIMNINDLPAEDYTVQMVLSPKGCTENNGSGNRYYDEVSQYGQYLDNGFAFGPFKAMSFVCMRYSPKDGRLEHRWVYQKSGCWAAAGYKYLAMESCFEKYDDKSLCFTVTHNQQENTANGKLSSVYGVYEGSDRVAYVEITESGFIAKDDADDLFNIMYGIPGTIYAVRIYDRLLTTKEIQQNHVADLVYYYGLDLTLLNQAIEAVGDAGLVYSKFVDMDFSMTKEEAVAAFEQCIGALWAEVAGISIRLDNKVGVRAEFNLMSDVIASMEQNGFTFKVSVFANLEKNVFPTLEAHDYAITVYDNGKKADQYFFDGDAFGFSVRYNYPDREMMLKDVRFTLHVSAVDASGKEIVIVTNVDTQMGTTAFHAYNHMSKTDYSNNRFVNTTVDSCYEVNELYVGDASKENNFETVAEAITKLIEIIGEAGTLPVDVRVKLADGVHYLKETVTVSSESFDPAANYRFSIKGGSAEDVKVTSNIAIDSSKFTPVSGKGYYSYQFAKDAEGNYPKFRYLYVDGEIATLAHEGILHFNDGEQYKMPFEKGYDASMGLDILYKVNEKGDTVKKSAAELIADINAHPNMAKNKFYMYESIFANCQSEADYRQMELHIQCQWDFNIIHVDHVDFNDVAMTEDGKKCVAVYFNEEERDRFQIPGGYTLIAREHWMENSLAFLDEPGEYYYDLETGMLFYYPEEGTSITDATLEYPCLDNLFVFDGADNFTIEGITFTGADDFLLSERGHCGGQAGGDGRLGGFPTRAAIYVKNGTSASAIRSCIFDNLGCEGVTMRGRLEHVTIEENQFFSTGATALRMADNSSAWNTTMGLYDISIIGNYINRTAWSIRQCCATQFGSAKDFVMTNNTILNSAYTAISIGWRWSVAGWEYGDTVNLDNVMISYNYISHFMTDQKDGGAIYTLGGNVNPSYHEYFNFLDSNYIVFTKDTGCNGMVCGIYHDGSSSNWHDTYNVIAAASSANTADRYNHYSYIYIQHIDGQETHNNFVEGNIVFNLKNTDYDKQRNEVYRYYLDTKNAETERFIKEADTVYIAGLEGVEDSDIPYIVEYCGSPFMMPSLDEVMGDDY